MTVEGLGKGSPERFGYKWDIYADIRPEHEEQFLRWTAPLEPTDWRGLSFLDVGCGMGRNSFWPLSYGAGRGVAVDVDARSLGRARQTLRQFPNAEIQEISAYELPYRDEFDICFSIGVIHHLSDPVAALRKMAQAAKPGGRILIWVYGRENNEWIVRFIDPLRNAILSRLPMRVLHHLSIYPTFLLWCALRAGFGRTSYMKLIGGFRFAHLREIVVDQLLPRTAQYWSRAEVESLMRQAGLDPIELRWVNEISWTAIGTKPRTAAA